MTKKRLRFTQNKTFLIFGLGVLATAILFGILGYYIGQKKENSSTVPTTNVPGYIVADQARDQVNNFYRQYLNPRKDTPEESRKMYVKSYGSQNLAFYSQYYRHGFDPIVCSTVMPTSVTAKEIRAGVGAVVYAEAKYPDGSTADIDLTLVINSEGFKIDSITCPGSKGNLPPAIQ